MLVAMIDRLGVAVRLMLVVALASTAPALTQSSSEDALSYKLLLDRAQNGQASAMNGVGVALAEGKGVSPDQQQAVVWFRRAAELGDADGAGNLGFHYFRGHGLKRDNVLAAKWFFICHCLDSLRCHPNDFVDLLGLSRRQYLIAWRAALSWLRARPDLKDDFGDRPWFGRAEFRSTDRSYRAVRWQGSS
jgi:TPR repeat protein